MSINLLSERVKLDTNYGEEGWYFMLGISFVPSLVSSPEAYQYTLGLELGFWHFQIGLGRKL